MNRVLVIGVDGATWDLLKPWMQQGYLSNLSKLKKKGISGNLRSTIPSMTAAAWSSFATGREPSNTGIFGFYSRYKESYSVHTNSSQGIDGTTLWQHLSRYNKKSILINLPLTYPAGAFNGRMITGLPTPDKNAQGFTYPEDLFRQIGLDKDSYIIRVRLGEYENRYDELIRDLKRMIRQRLNVARALIQEPWDFFMVHFYASDVAQHALWKFIDEKHPQYNKEDAKHFGNRLLEVFTEVDEAIGKLLECINLENITIILLSDHGFGSNYYTIHINKWLQEIGMLRFHRPLSRMGICLSKKVERKLHLPLTGSLTKVMESFASIPGYLIPKNLQDLFDGRAREIFSKYPRISYLFKLRGYNALFEAVDWKNTKAYSIGTSGMVFLNVRGREPIGSLNPGSEVLKVLDFITDEFYKLRDEKGMKIIDRVYRKEEIYRGKHFDEAPDLIPVTENKGCYFYPYLDRENIVSDAEAFRTGNHRINGIFLAKGPGVLQNKEIENARIIDIAPTILYLLGIGIPEDVDGRLLIDIFKGDYIKEHSISKMETPTISHKGDEGISSDDEGKIRKRLEDLGYI